MDLDKHVVRVCRSAIGVDGQVLFKETKTGLGRTIPLPEFAVSELRAHKKQQVEQRLLMGNRWQEHGLVCAAEDSSPMKPQWLSSDFRYFAKSRGYKINFHGLRRTHAIILLQQGINPKIVQKRLGHTDIGVALNTHSRLIGDVQETAAQALDLALGEASVARKSLGGG